MTTLNPLQKCFWTATFCLLIFYFQTAHLNFPFLVDEYLFLFHSYQPDFNLTKFTFLLTQRPLSSILNFLSFKFHVFEKTHLLFYLYFFLHSSAIIGILNWLYQKLSIQEHSPKVPNAIWISGFITALFPAYHEVLYMALNLPYALGLFFLWLGLLSRSSWLRILMFSCSFLLLETYIPMSFVLLLLPEIIKKGPFIKRIKGPMFQWLISGLVASARSQNLKFLST